MEKDPGGRKSFRVFEWIRVSRPAYKEKDYTERLLQFGVEEIRVYGIAFCEKRCGVVTELMEP